MRLFNLKTNQWRHLTLDSNLWGWSFKLASDMARVFIKWYFCWLGQVRANNVSITGVLCNSIIIFNSIEERFDYILLPQCLSGTRLRLGNLADDFIAV
ncbi:hypothetical protein M0R45_030522 [Rubus argutus]|uniref:F-box/kelch-repeat protein n=1 Tax=Rubus argutus TaxID=59490 RepID=A0AAW1WDI3_RUBAR